MCLKKALICLSVDYLVYLAYTYTVCIYYILYTYSAVQYIIHLGFFHLLICHKHLHWPTRLQDVILIPAPPRVLIRQWLEKLFIIGVSLFTKGTSFEPHGPIKPRHPAAQISDDWSVPALVWIPIQGQRWPSM